MNTKALLNTGCIITLSSLMGQGIPLDLPLRVVGSENASITTKIIENKAIQPKPSAAATTEKKDEKASESGRSGKEADAKALEPQPLKKDALTITQGAHKAQLTLRQLLTSKKGALLDFWAWWCPPCVQGIPHLIETEKELSAKDIAVAGISVDKSWTKTQSVQQANKIQFPWLMDDDKNPIAKALEIDSIPRWILLDNKGNILFNGHPTLDKAAYQKALKELESQKL